MERDGEGYTEIEREREERDIHRDRRETEKDVRRERESRLREKRTQDRGRRKEGKGAGRPAAGAARRETRSQLTRESSWTTVIEPEEWRIAAPAHDRCTRLPPGSQLTGRLSGDSAGARAPSDLCPPLCTRVPANDQPLSVGAVTPEGGNGAVPWNDPSTAEREEQEKGEGKREAEADRRKGNKRERESGTSGESGKRDEDQGVQARN